MNQIITCMRILIRDYVRVRISTKRKPRAIYEHFRGFVLVELDVLIAKVSLPIQLIKSVTYNKLRATLHL